MARLFLIEDIVRDILNECPEAKQDDFILIEKVYSKFINTELSLKSIFKNHIAFKLPSIASITRARRKIQEKERELVDEKTKEIRTHETLDYKEYAKI